MSIVTTSFLVHILSCLIITCGVLVIVLEHPIYSLINLVLVYVCSSVWLFLVGAEYFAFIYLIVYVGAISVLFVFAVMMLNLRGLPMVFADTGVLRLPGCVLVVAVLLIPFNVYDSSFFATAFQLGFSDFASIGVLLFGSFWPFLILLGVVLLVAMIGSLFLVVV